MGVLDDYEYQLRTKLRKNITSMSSGEMYAAQNRLKGLQAQIREKQTPKKKNNNAGSSTPRSSTPRKNSNNSGASTQHFREAEQQSLDKYEVYKMIKDAMERMWNTGHEIDEATLEAEIPEAMLRDNPDMLDDIAKQVADEMGDKGDEYDIDVTAEAGDSRGASVIGDYEFDKDQQDSMQTDNTNQTNYETNEETNAEGQLFRDVMGDILTAAITSEKTYGLVKDSDKIYYSLKGVSSGAPTFFKYANKWGGAIGAINNIYSGITAESVTMQHAYLSSVWFQFIPGVATVSSALNSFREYTYNSIPADMQRTVDWATSTRAIGDTVAIPPWMMTEALKNAEQDAADLKEKIKNIFDDPSRQIGEDGWPIYFHMN